jgi:three-Cys-motif partner protein
MKAKGPQFGGDWTEEKLEKVRKYLNAYTQALKKQPFDLIYIDAFAGAGYRELRAKEDSGTTALLFPELVEPESQKFMDGSARIALKVDPPFKRFVFIEKDSEQYSKLAQIKSEFPEKAENILLIEQDANDFLLDYCSRTNWQSSRAVLFMDPFGMQVKWQTVEAIAKTKAIDFWYLFPLEAFNRMMKKDGNLDPTWEQKLDDVLGDKNWREAFFRSNQTPDFFTEQLGLSRTADWKGMIDYFKGRLSTVFTGVAENPLTLYNSKNVPLFLLCFACGGSEKGSKLALKIAQDILRK